jgi:hypothetical protein
MLLAPPDERRSVMYTIGMPWLTQYVEVKVSANAGEEEQEGEACCPATTSWHHSRLTMTRGVYI